uniref:Follicular dendritic cell secreted protein n=1 Tax=Ursus maritimus TaxID=29073 RepID=A0A452T9R9_URSMA
KMKVLLLITAILALTAGFPVSIHFYIPDGSNESPSPFYGPRFQYPFGPYPPFLYPGYPWFRFFYPPFPIPLSVPTTLPPNEQ